MTTLSHLLLRVGFGATVFALAAVARAQPNPKPAPTGSISGHVLVNGKGATGIEVGAIGDASNRRLAAAQTKTDSEGFYRLEGLAAGNYQVVTFTPQLTPAEPSSDFGSMFSAAKGILLAEGENVTDIDINLIRGGVITGRVTDADNKPVIEERVTIEPVVEQGQRPPRLPPSYGNMYQTDDRGIFRVYGLPAGRYRVSAGRIGPQFFGSLTTVNQQTFHPDVTDASKAEIINLTEGSEAKDVDIRMGRREDTFAITGRVVDAETGLPVATAPLGIVTARGSISFGTSLQSAADGKFTVDGVTAGRYGVYVASENGNNEFYSDPVFVEVSDKDVSGVEIKAVRGLTVSGSVTAENIDMKELLKQVPGLRVGANVVPLTGMTQSTIRSYGSGTVAADGSFTITGLRPGRVMFNVMSSDSQKRPSVLKVSIGGVGLPQGFEIERGQPVSGIQILVTYGTGAIRGSVTFVGAPLSNYRSEVICYRDSRAFTGGAYLDSRGHFIMRQLAPGTYECGLQYINITGGPQPRPPAPPPRQSVTVSNGVEAELNFVVDLTPKGVSP